MSEQTIGFIGLGLIGGSIARGIKRAHPDTVIMAYMRSRARLEQAKQEGRQSGMCICHRRGDDGTDDRTC